MNLFDARAEYARALEVSTQWHRLARKTDNPRHLEAALVCSRIAREAFTKVQTERLSEHERQALLQIQRAAELEASLDEMQRHIAACRAMLEASAPAPQHAIA